MSKNMGKLDRIVRAAVAVLFVLLAISGLFPNWLAILFGIVAVILLVTSAIGFCPLYVPLKISTKK